MAPVCVTQMSVVKPCCNLGAARPVPAKQRKPLLRRSIVVGADKQEKAQSAISDVIEKVEEKAQEFVQATQENSGIKPETLNVQPGNLSNKSGVVKDAFELESPGTSFLPEIVNGRAAMVGMLAAFGAEVANHEPVFVQIQRTPLAIAATFATIIIASIIPVVRGADLGMTSGPFTPKAERWNGRLAMVSFAALLLVETWKAGPGLVPF